MKKYLTQTFICFTLVALVAGCSKKVEGSEESTEQKHADNQVVLSNDALKYIDLDSVRAKLKNLGMTLKVAGRLSANLNKTARITSTLEGRLVKFNVDLSDQVKKGDVLAIVESPELLGKELEIKSPIAGIVTNRAATTGELVDKSKEILTVSDPSALWLIAEVKERDIAAVKVGQEVTFQVLSYPSEKFSGTVVLTGNQVEEDSRTLEVRISVANPQGLLKPGMFADVSIVTTVLENVLVIPDEALQTAGEEQIVFVALDDTRFERRVVKVGLEQDGNVQVLSGVVPEEKVITRGSFVLKSEMLKGELGEE